MINFYLSLFDKFMNTPEMFLSPMDKLQILLAFVLPIALIYLLYLAIVEIIDRLRSKK